MNPDIIARRSNQRQRVDRTAHCTASDLEHMGVDHRRGDVGVPQQRLHRADVIAGLQDMGCERVAQRVRRGRLEDSGAVDGAFESALERLVVHVVSADYARALIG